MRKHMIGKGTMGLTRRAFLTSAVTVGIGMLLPDKANAEPNAFLYAESPTVYGYSTDGYYQFSGNMQLGVEEGARSTLWTNFECNRICAEGSILTIAWIQYGIEMVATTRDLNEARTDRRYVTTVCNHTNNYGAGVIGYSQVFLDQVAGGNLDYGTVSTGPFVNSSAESFNFSSSSGRFPARGTKGEHGEIQLDDILYPTAIDRRERSQYFGKHAGKVYIPLYKRGSDEVIGRYGIDNTLS